MSGFFGTDVLATIHLHYATRSPESAVGPNTQNEAGTSQNQVKYTEKTEAETLEEKKAPPPGRKIPLSEPPGRY